MMIQLTKIMNAVPRRIKTLGSGVALGGLMLLALGCEFANAEEARGALQDVREVRQVQDLEITPRLDRLEALRQDEILPREQQIQRLSREVQAIYRDQIIPLQSGAGSVTDVMPLSDVMTAMDDRTRELRDRSLQLGRETQLSFDRLANEDSTVRFEQERVFRDKQDAIHDLFQRIDDTYKTTDRHLNALYNEQQDIESKLNRMPSGSMSPDMLREKLDAINTEIFRLEGQVRSNVNEIEGMVNDLELEIRRLKQLVDEQWGDIRFKQQELDRLYAEKDSPYQNNVELESLYRELNKVQDALSSAEFTDIAVLREELGSIEQEIIDRKAQFNIEVAELQTYMADMEVAASQLLTELADMKSALRQKQADLETFTSKLEQTLAAGSGLDALYQRQRELLAELNTAGTDATRTSDQNTLASTDLQEELRIIEQQIVEGEAAYQAHLAAIKEDIAWILGEIDRLHNALAIGDGELQEKHRIISDILGKLDHLNANGPQTDDLYQWREEIERKLADVEPVEVVTLKEKLASIHDQIARVEGTFEEKTSTIRQDIASLESAIDRLHRSVAEHERDLFAKQDMVNDLWNKMNTTDNRGEHALNNLYADREDLERRLADIPFDYVDPALLRQEWNSVNDQIRSVNNRLHVEIDRLEQLIRGLEDEMYTMDRDIQDQDQVRQRQFSEVDSELRDRQFLLDSERNDLEDQMWREFIDRQVVAENARVAVTEKIVFIMETEIEPLEVEIAALELELEELYASERSLQLELRKLKAELGDAERDVETRILDLLDEALSNFTDAPPTDAPATDVPTGVITTTDALGTTLAPLAPVQ